MNFEEALNAIKSKSLVTRSGWNGKDQYVGLCDNWMGNFNPNSPDYYVKPFLYIRSAQAEISPWLPTQADLLADDWKLLE